jgi:hypothetical protein
MVLKLPNQGMCLEIFPTNFYKLDLFYYFMRKRKQKECSCKSYSCNSCGNGVYGLGFLGAVIYYISTATSFWMGVLGILKALVWPAFLIYEVLKFLVA